MVYPVSGSMTVSFVLSGKLFEYSVLSGKVFEYKVSDENKIITKK
jgi:hypothetical protein